MQGVSNIQKPDAMVSSCRGPSSGYRPCFIFGRPHPELAWRNPAEALRDVFHSQVDPRPEFIPSPTVGPCRGNAAFPEVVERLDFEATLERAEHGERTADAGCLAHDQAIAKLTKLDRASFGFPWQQAEIRAVGKHGIGIIAMNDRPDSVQNRAQAIAILIGDFQEALRDLPMPGRHGADRLRRFLRLERIKLRLEPREHVAATVAIDQFVVSEVPHLRIPDALVNLLVRVLDALVDLASKLAILFVEL